MNIPSEKLKELERDFSDVINKHCLENLSNTPDFILARFLISSIINFSTTSKSREKWYGKFLSIAQSVECTSCKYRKEVKGE